MSIINWQKVRRETDIPKDRRLLLIGQPTNVTPDGGLLDTYDVVVGHWNRHRGAFMPVHLDFQSYERMSAWLFTILRNQFRSGI
jgi:hypothetical protein